MLAMKKYLLLIPAFLFVIACGNKQNVDSVSFEIMHVSEYCGGTEPPESLIEELHTPSPFSDTLYIHADTDHERKSEPMLLLLKKGKGEIIGLGPGCYLAYTTVKMHKDSIKNLTEVLDCQIEMGNRPLFLFNVYEDTKLVTDTVMIECDPCLPRP